MQVQFWSVAYLKGNQETMRVLFKKKKHANKKKRESIISLKKNCRQTNKDSLFLNVSKKTYDSYVFVVARWKIAVKYNGIAEYRC